jgi:hypothetical protein
VEAATGREAATPKPAPHCVGDRRRPKDTIARSRVRKGAPAAAEQLCLAV